MSALPDGIIVLPRLDERLRGVDIPFIQNGVDSYRQEITVSQDDSMISIYHRDFSAIRSHHQEVYLV